MEGSFESGFNKPDVISDFIYSYNPDAVFGFLKSKFPMHVETILKLPMFSGFHIDEEGQGNPDDMSDYISIGEMNLVSVPLADDAQISLLGRVNFERCDVTVQQFKNIFLNGKIRNVVNIWYVDFLYKNGQITGIVQYVEPT